MWRLLAGLLFAVVTCAAADGKQLTFEFSGSGFTSASPYGISMSFGTPVSGQFKIDTDSVLTNTFDTNDVGFRQEIAGGFTASFAGVPVVADEYIIRLINDEPQTFGGPADFFSIIFDSNLVSGPPFPDPFPLSVDGATQTEGYIELNFVANTLYSGSTLPTSLGFSETLEFADFDRGAPPFFSFFDDEGGPPGGSAALFAPSSFALVPEPSAWALGAIGAVVAFLFWRWKLQRRVMA